ncbi:oligosaccharide repeat unit polymerase [Acinetobacter sp. A3.8]|uniref:Oligosaccharide repeat unit polymerase n=1 Tax=Acinetobacter sedimenti TaxID=2919922 RepID=A0A9X1WYI4_9GAMM|nr:O-antigen polymerase [Acinetobacter sedimenti]MCJ8146352.1 oligosaccharide repeat unit polymerase [Acinetobacter sedimenti]
MSFIGQGFGLLVYLSSFVFLLVQSFNVFNFRSNYVWFVFSYLVLFYISPIFEFVFPGEVLVGSQSSIALYHFLNISSIHALSIFYFLVFRPTPESKLLINDAKFDRTLYIIGGGLLLGTLWMFLTVGGFSAIKSTRVDLKYVQGGKTYSLWMVYFFSSFFFLLGIKLAKIKRNPLYIFILLLIFCVLEFVYFIALRNRTMILMHLTALIIGVFVSKQIVFENTKKYLNEKIKKIKILPLVSVMSILAGLGIFIRFARGVYLEGDGELGISWKDMLITSVKSGDFGYANMVVNIIDHVYYTDLSLNGQSYYRLLLAFIPESIYDKKIPTTDSLIGQMLTGLDVMTIPPGVFGDAYLNFGLLSFFVFIVYGLLLGAIDRSKNILKAYIFFSLSFTLIYHFVRGSFVNVIISLIIIYLGVILANRLVRPKYI